MTEETTPSAGLTADSRPMGRSRRAVPAGSMLLRGVALLSVVLITACWAPSPARGAGVPIEGKLLVNSVGSLGSYYMEGTSDTVTSVGSYSAVDVSPLGDLLAYSQVMTCDTSLQPRGCITTDVWTAHLDGSTAVDLTTSLGGVNCEPIWSPDGSKIAFNHVDPVAGLWHCQAGFRPWVMNADGAGAHQVSDRGRVADWAPDGYRLLVELGDGMAAVDVDGGNLQKLALGRGDGAYSPDGTKVAYSADYEDAVGGEPGRWRTLEVANADGSGPQALLQQFISYADVCAYIEAQGLGADFDVWFDSVLAWFGPFRPTWSPRGDRIALLAMPSLDPGVSHLSQVEVWVYDIPTSDLTRLTQNQDWEQHLRWNGNNTFPDDPEVTVGNTTVSFADVAREGLTTILRDPEPPPLPEGYVSCAECRDIKTTALYAGPITITMTYRDEQVPTGTAVSKLAILRCHGDYWEDVTASHDTAKRAVSATTDSLSLFALCGLRPSHFADVPATGLGPGGADPYWAFLSIEACVDAGIVSGYPDGTFHPSASVTRDQMAVFLVRALGQEPSGPVTPQSWKDVYGYDPAVPATWAVDFTDVPASGWGSPAGPYWAWYHIQRLYELGVTQGVTATEYGPTQEVRRDQMAVFLIRALGQECSNPCVDTTCWPYDPATPATWAHDFADIPATGQDTCHGAHWAWYHIQALYETGVTLGCGDGTNYCPGDSVRRDEMAVFLARAFLGM